MRDFVRFEQDLNISSSVASDVDVHKYFIQFNLTNCTNRADGIEMTAFIFSIYS